MRSWYHHNKLWPFYLTVTLESVFWKKRKDFSLCTLVTLFLFCVTALCIVIPLGSFNFVVTIVISKRKLIEFFFLTFTYCIFLWHTLELYYLLFCLFQFKHVSNSHCCTSTESNPVCCGAHRW